MGLGACAAIAQAYRRGINRLGIDKTPADTRVLVAMSGGVDSSVISALLAREGHRLICVTLQLYGLDAAGGSGEVQAEAQG